MSVASLGLFSYLLPVCILPVFVVFAGLYSFKSFSSQSQYMRVFWSALIVLIVLEVGKTVILQFAPWVYDLTVSELIGFASLSMVPSVLVTFIIFQVFKATYFAEQSVADILQQSLLAVGITFIFIVFKVYDIKVFSQVH